MSKLDLNDLQPQEATFQLSEHEGVTFTLKKFSLRAQLWLNDRFGADSIKGIFENQRLAEISEVVFFLLKDRTVIKSVEELQESVVTNKDRIAIMSALLKTIGISQPVMEKITKSVESGNVESLNQLIGAQSTT